MKPNWNSKNSQTKSWNVKHNKLILALWLISLALISQVSALKAQIPNSSFEKLNPDGSLCNWGNVYLFPIWLDSTGVSHGDSIVYDSNFYTASNDAFGGSHALQLSNAWNYTTNTGIAGAAACDDDSLFSSWGLLNLIPTNAGPFTPFAPFNFGFNYKFFPVYGDSAYAEIALWDSVGNLLGSGELIISDSSNTYTQASAPINYYLSGDASFYSLSIHNFYTSQPGVRQPNFGTRLIVDNVGFNFVSSTTAVKVLSLSSKLSVFPNPVVDKIKLDIPSESAYEIEVMNNLGDLVLSVKNKNELNVSALSAGLYQISVKQNGHISSSKFIKN